MQSSRHSLAAAAADEYDFFAKVALAGDAGVGKSELLKSMVDQPGMGFSIDYKATIGMRFNTNFQQISGKTIKLQIWDTAGQERYRVVKRAYYRGARVIPLCYDVTNRKSFENLSFWQTEISQCAPENTKVILVGIKSDLEDKRAVTNDEAQAFATQYDYGFMEVSNNSRTNIQELRQLVTSTFYNSLLNEKKNSQPRSDEGSASLPSLLASSSSSPLPSQSRNLKTPGMIILASSAALWLFSSPATLAKVALCVTYGQLAKAGMVIGAVMTACGFLQSRRDRRRDTLSRYVHRKVEGEDEDDDDNYGYRKD